MRETFWGALKNRLFQVVALYIPGARSIRVWLHRHRGVRIGENSWIGTAAIIETGFPSLVSIGDNVHIGIRSVIIAHFREAIQRSAAGNEASVRIEDDVYIGPGAIILPYVTIGRGAVVAAGSVVNQSVAPLTMVQGNPAKPVARCGIPLRGNRYEDFLRNLEPIED